MLMHLLFARFAQAASSFTVALVPDTQHYCETAQNSATFTAQTQWIVANVGARDIVFVAHVGDIVEHGSNATEWSRADSAMDELDVAPPAPPDGNVPYCAALGNHDYDVLDDKSSATNFLAHFGAGRYAGKTWFLGASSDGRNLAQRFWTGSGPMVHLALEWHPADDGIAWAQSMLAAHPDEPAIVTTHEYLQPGNPGVRDTGGGDHDGAGDNSAEDLFRKLVEPFPQVCLVLGGHHQGNGRATATTALGRSVLQILADYQDDPGGGNGWMRMLELRPASGQLVSSTVSPTYIAGVSSGPDRSLDPDSNFTQPFDLEGMRDDLRTRATLHFRQGQDGGFGVYALARDTYVGDGSAGITLPNVAYGSAPTLRVDGDDDREQALLVFSGIIGSAPGRIPLGTTIERATLTLTTEGSGAASVDGGSLHRMLVPWNEASTWNSLGAGVQLGSEAVSTADANSAGLVSSKGTCSIDVTASVQAWANGSPNYGWVVVGNGNDRWDFRASDWASVAERPLLTVRWLSACPTPERHCVAATNSASNGAWLDWLGSTSLAANDATLIAHALPPGKVGLYFYGAQRTFVPFGDGFRCVSSPVVRLGPPASSSAQGVLQRALDFASPPLSSGSGAVSAGSIWSFQGWYRDPNLLGGSGTNLTDALETSFCPR
jgi:hypothetical protein